MSKSLVAIPAYNEEENVAAVIEQVRQVLPGTDILVVNDGSTDRTGETARRKQAMVLDLKNKKPDPGNSTGENRTGEIIGKTSSKCLEII